MKKEGSGYAAGADEASSPCDVPASLVDPPPNCANPAGRSHPIPGCGNECANDGSPCCPYPCPPVKLGKLSGSDPAPPASPNAGGTGSGQLGCRRKYGWPSSCVKSGAEWSESARCLPLLDEEGEAADGEGEAEGSWARRAALASLEVCFLARAAAFSALNVCRG